MSLWSWRETCSASTPLMRRSSLATMQGNDTAFCKAWIWMLVFSYTWNALWMAPSNHRAAPATTNLKDCANFKCISECLYDPWFACISWYQCKCNSKFQEHLPSVLQLVYLNETGAFLSSITHNYTISHLLTTFLPHLSCVTRTSIHDRHEILQAKTTLDSM